VTGRVGAGAAVGTGRVGAGAAVGTGRVGAGTAVGRKSKATLGRGRAGTAGGACGPHGRAGTAGGRLRASPPRGLDPYQACVRPQCGQPTDVDTGALNV